MVEFGEKRRNPCNKIILPISNSQSGLAGEEEALQKRNQVLKAKCLKMEGLVERMKKQFLKRVAKPQTPLDLDKIMADRLAKF